MIHRPPSAASLQRQLKPAHLRLMAEILSAGQLGLAAERIGIAQPAASRLMAEIERIIGHPVHARDGRSLRLTPVGAALARRAARIQLELQDAAREILGVVAGTEGHVRIGSVTGPALNYILPVLQRLRGDAPGITADVVVGTSDLLCEQLVAGRLDFALGRVPPALEADLDMQVIGEEPLALMVSRGHPLLAASTLTAADVLAYDWVMPEDETLLTRTVRQRLAALGLGLPRRQISTSSFLFTLALLKESDAVAPLALPVVERFAGEDGGLFARLPLDLGLTVEAFGLIHRRGTELPPTARRMADAVLARAE